MATRSPDATPRTPITVASNRLPFSYQRTAQGLERKPSPGGLVSALDPVLRKQGGTWVGWPGIVSKEGDAPLESDDYGYAIAPVPLTESEVTRYYHGFSNRTLWPLFHSMTERAQFDGADYASYETVNDRFADEILRVADDDALVWVHDYQLMLAPRRIREQRADLRLAFFLHIPFPPFDIFRLLPWDRELLRSLLACDLIGFHVRGYAQNFMDCVERTLGARVHRREMFVEYGTRTTRIGAFPIGIEFEEFESLAKGAKAREPGREKIVLGVDRLDYTKGIPERIRAFERLLELHPEHREHVVLLQLAVPSRSQVSEYKELKREIDELVGSINGRFATANWSPIRYLYRSVPQERLATIYRDADVALVTPLRDGMNLVAKEFVACQVADPGVLILSRLAGAADTMRESLLVNPYDVDGTAEAIHRALGMDETERASRMSGLRRRERRKNLDVWTQSFLEEAFADRASVQPMADSDFEDWLGEFLDGYRLALFIDYDGTLTPLCDHPDNARLAPEMRSALRSCTGRSDTDVAIVSGRALADVRKMVGEAVPTYAGNHGLEIEGHHIGHFEHEDLVHYRERADGLAEELDAIATGGAWTERKGPTLTFHFRAVPEHERDQLVAEAREIIGRAGYQPRDAHCAVEARPPIGWDKGRAVLHILKARYGPAWSESIRVVYVGDDITDEDAFRFLAGLSRTFRVGSPDTPTAATHRLPDVDAVQSLLQWIGRRPEVV
jgi:trehalose 6-phosphate synthase/phosphatase